MLKSTLFDVERTATGYRFAAAGAATASGCAWSGAARMAAAGRSAREILARYFPGPRFGRRRSRPGRERHRDRDCRYPPARRGSASAWRDEPGGPPGVLGEDGHSAAAARSARLSSDGRGVCARHREAVVDGRVPRAATGSTFIPPSALRDRRTPRATLRHELAHVVTAERLAGRPIWVHEAVAMDLGGDPRIAARRQADAGAGGSGIAPGVRPLSCPTDAEWRAFDRPTPSRRPTRAPPPASSRRRAPGDDGTRCGETRPAAGGWRLAAGSARRAAQVQLQFRNRTRAFPHALPTPSTSAQPTFASSIEDPELQRDERRLLPVRREPRRAPVHALPRQPHEHEQDPAERSAGDAARRASRSHARTPRTPPKPLDDERPRQRQRERQADGSGRTRAATRPPRAALAVSRPPELRHQPRVDLAAVPSHQRRRARRPETTTSDEERGAEPDAGRPPSAAPRQAPRGRASGCHASSADRLDPSRTTRSATITVERRRGEHDDIRLGHASSSQKSPNRHGVAGGEPARQWRGSVGSFGRPGRSAAAAADGQGLRRRSTRVASGHVHRRDLRRHRPEHAGRRHLEQVDELVVPRGERLLEEDDPVVAVLAAAAVPELASAARARRGSRCWIGSTPAGSGSSITRYRQSVEPAASTPHEQQVSRLRGAVERRLPVDDPVLPFWTGVSEKYLRTSASLREPVRSNGPARVEVLAPRPTSRRCRRPSCGPATVFVAGRGRRGDDDRIRRSQRRGREGRACPTGAPFTSTSTVGVRAALLRARACSRAGRRAPSPSAWCSTTRSP